MKYVKISNNGALDRRNLYTVGLSSKTGDPTKIGQWGSGLKYAVAWLVRNNVEFILAINGVKVEFSTREEEIQGKVHQMLNVDGKETDLCINFGHDWQAWEVVREIYSNSRDEPSFAINFDCAAAVLDISGQELPWECTEWYLPKDGKLANVFWYWDSYFDDKRELVEQITMEKHSVRILEKKGEGLTIFKSGICVFRDEKTQAVFDYDIPEIAITETRTLADNWNARRLIARALMEASMTTLVAMMQNMSAHREEDVNEFFEGKIDLEWCGSSPNKNWEEMVSTQKLVPQGMYTLWKDRMEEEKVVVVPDSIFAKVKASFKGKLSYTGSYGYYDSRTKQGATPIANNAAFKRVLEACEVKLRRVLPQRQWANTYVAGKFGDKTKWAKGEIGIVWITSEIQEMPFLDACEFLMKVIILCEIGTKAEDLADMVLHTMKIRKL